MFFFNFLFWNLCFTLKKIFKTSGKEALDSFSWCSCTNLAISVSAEGMISQKDYFQNGKVNKGALVSFIRDIKKNTKLSDEDAAIIAASKV